MAEGEGGGDEVADALFLQIVGSVGERAEEGRRRKKKKTHQLLHLWEPSLDFPIPHQLPSGPPLLPLTFLLLRPRLVPLAQQPHAEPPTGFWCVSREKGDGFQAGRRRGGGRGREGDEEFCLRPGRTVEPLQERRRRSAYSR